MAAKREHFASSITAMSALAGSAIGLGNIWRFPYITGQNGGAAFILIYLFCVLFLAVPIMLCETVIGRNAGANTFRSLEKLAPGTAWKWLGLLTVLTPLIILSYYSVVGGWSIHYFAKSLISGFSAENADLFASFNSSIWMPLLSHTVFLGITALIVLRGVKKGIELFNKFSIPVLFALILAIAVYSVTLPGAEEGVRYLVKPDFKSVNADTFISALGQAFFSLSLGVGTVLTYSSYMKKDGDILKVSAGTALADMIFAVVAGFAIMPAVFASGMEPGIGPGLIFETLPFIFVKLGIAAPVLSRIMSVLFFLTIVVAALTSSISMFEVGVAYLVEERKISRRKAVLRIFIGTWLLGALCSLSFGPLSGMKLFGLTLFSLCDMVTSNFLMTFGALLFVIFTGWKLDRELVRNEFTNNGSIRFNNRIFGSLYFQIRYVEPIVILVIFLFAIN